ncbi:hypothetical protein, conserved [Eimeria necatrix]|uniref:Uncharacterized protein n=1 Tax=Eimeria necatrix TaxID=51315 RepID=U6MJC2_9EIME|nr:hypothetical protein, conserved [Eimeria necatrix]CDJ64116.1 hypothetical protein, conserved [Eimeria necatrix]
MAGAILSTERRGREIEHKQDRAASSRVVPRCRSRCTRGTPIPARLSTTSSGSVGTSTRKRESEVPDPHCDKENSCCNVAGVDSGAATSPSSACSANTGRPPKLQRRLTSNASAMHGAPTTHGSHDRKGDDSGGDSGAPRLHRELKGLIHAMPLKSRRVSAYFPDWNLKQKLDYLLKMGVVATTKVNESEEVHTLSICSQFAEENHLALLQDSDRVSHYRKAMHWVGDPSSGGKKLVEGRRVLEIGTGPICLLSINAVNAGAKHVVALEASRPSHCRAKKFVEAIGMSHKIDIVHGYSKRIPVELFKKPEVVIHEIIGDFASQEGVADALLDVQERTGSIPLSIPFGAETLICPASLPEPEHFLYPAHSYEGRSILSPRRILLQSVRLNTSHLLLSEEFQAFETLKFQSPMKNQMEQRKTLKFVISKPGSMAGLLTVIKIEIYPGTFFGTFRNGETDSWYTSLVLLPEEVKVEPGDVVSVESCSDMRNYCKVSSPKSPLKAGSKTDMGFVLVSKPTYSFTVSIYRPSFSFRRAYRSFPQIVVPFEEQAPVLYGATRKYADKR